jgi:hypothetical protein
LKANALRRAVEAERRVYAKGGDAAGIIADLWGASIETDPPGDREGAPQIRPS